MVYRMESYNWKFSYNAIFIHWCIGYLDRPQAINFLKKARSKLKKATKCCGLKTIGDSYIFLFDNLRPVLLPEQTLDGQRWRTQEEL